MTIPEDSSTSLPKARMNKRSKNASDYNRDELASSDQLRVLHEQINHSLSERRTLIRSRNRITMIAIASWLVTLFVLFILPQLEENRETRLKNETHAKQLAAQQLKTTALDCLANSPVIPAVSDPSNNEADAYIKKVRKLLHGSNKEDTKVINSQVSAIDISSIADTNPAHKKEISRFIYKWATIWELQDTEDYFQLYSRQFHPDYKADNFSTWKKLRSYYIKKHAWIKIKIEDIKIIKFTGTSATVTFLQDFRTPTYFDRTLKKLKLIMEDGEWRIYRESGTTQNVNFNAKQ